MRTIQDVVPNWLTVLYTLLVVAIAPLFALEYGVRNFLWFSNVALFGTLLGILLNSRLLIGMMTLAILLPAIGWNAIFGVGLIFGVELIPLISYMFDERIPLWARALSLYHLPLPFLLVWIVWKTGYDARALWYQTVLSWFILPLSLYVSTPQQNINWSHGFLENGRPLLDPPLHTLLLMTAFPLLIYWPVHLLLKRLFGRRGDAAVSSP